MKHYTAVMATAAVLALAPAQAAEPTYCQLAKKVVPDKACVDNPGGAVLGEDQQEAERLARLVAAGEERFRRHFAQEPKRYAIIQGGNVTQTKALKDAGFVHTMTWFTNAEYEQNALASVRRGTEAQMKAAGFGEDKVKQAVAQAEKAWLAQNPHSKRHASDASALPHEAAHFWFINQYWPGEKADGGGHYGGPGPDWLDELSAVVAEDDFSTFDRRDSFRKVYQGTPQKGSAGTLTVADITDINKFLHREHPMNGLQQGLMKNAKPGQNTILLTGEEARKASQGGILFYLQSRAVADFLIDRSGERTIFASIAEAFARGETIEQWLAAHGVKNRLGSNMAELEKIWREWLRARFGEPAAA